MIKTAQRELMIFIALVVCGGIVLNISQDNPSQAKPANKTSPQINYTAEINVNLATGCPTISSYEKYAQIASSENGSVTLQTGTNLNCRLMFKGDKVEVLE